MEVTQKKHGIILTYEGSFARAVAMGVIVRKPPTVWHILIPFVFILDFIRMNRETEIFTTNFLFTKKLALDAAFNISKGEHRQSILAQIENQTRDRLTAQKLYSWQIQQGQKAEVNLLIDHYSKLLSAEGDSYKSLVKSVYQTRDQLEAFLHQLTLAERKIDQAVIETLFETGEVKNSILTKHTVIDQMRTEGMNKLFLEARR